MSTLLALTHEVSTQLSQASSTVLAAPAPGGGDSGILDWLTTKLAATQTLFRTIGITGGMGFVIWQGIVSRGALARIIIAGIAAGIFVWIVWNVTSLQDRVDNEVNGARSPFSHSQLAAAHSAASAYRRGPT